MSVVCTVCFVVDPTLYIYLQVVDVYVVAP